MNRCWIGVGLLLLLLVLGLFTGVAMSRFWEDLARQITALADKSPADAREMLAATAQKWNSRRFLTAVFSDHAPMNEADTLFLLLEQGDPENFRENALRLAQLLHQLSQSQLPTLENIF